MQYPTHEVINQPPPLEGHNPFTLDLALGEALAREGAAWAADSLEELGALAGSAEAIEWGRLANENPPVLHTHDRFGHREDRIDFHPAYHQLMGIAIAAGLNAAPWADGRPGAHVVRAAKFIVWTSVEPGHLCPMSMTYSVVPTLAEAPGLLAEWLPRLASPEYDPAFAPATRKRGATAGMSLTEKQGGSDVRANTTVAEPDGEGAYLLTGHKWFVSGTMADVFLALAQAPEGPHLLLPAPLEAGRVQEQLLHPAVEGQDGRQVQRLQRGGVRRRLGAARRRGGARGAHHRRDGRPHPPRLLAGLGGPDAPRPHPGHPQRPPSLRLRQAPRRAGPDAAGAGRPGAGVGGGHQRRPAPRRGLRPGGPGRRAVRVRPHRHPGHQVLDLQAQRRRIPPRRWSASAAAATWRTPGCRACSARAR